MSLKWQYQKVPNTKPKKKTIRKEGRIKGDDETSLTFARKNNQVSEG